jgi:hypothetical protein
MIATQGTPTQRPPSTIQVVVCPTEEGVYQLFIETLVTGRHPIGPRLEKGKPLPSYASSYASREDALRDASALQKYLDESEERLMRHRYSTAHRTMGSK